MRLSTYRLSDYRLAAYVVAAAIIGGTIAFALDRATAPSAKIEANVAPPASGAVRQIPISRTTAADLGDPQGKLTPVYPAAPGKDLPIKDTPVVQAVKPPAETNGNANASGQTASPAPAAAPSVASAASPPANACNVAACAAAYRSFRESDCSYQPLVGARRTCEGAPGLGGQSSTGQVAAQPPQARPQYDTRGPAPVARGRYDDELRQVERTVRRLPPSPGGIDDDEDVVVIEAPQQRYDIRRNWISEPQD
jgi:hypothetical protein